jgi:3-methyladenine DNA glycosylase AlkD
VERAATDDRNFVRKGVSWALRAIGERNQALNTAALQTARRLGQSDDAAARWVGKDVLKQLASPAVRRRLAARRAKKAGPAARSGDRA